MESIQTQYSATAADIKRQLKARLAELEGEASRLKNAVAALDNAESALAEKPTGRHSRTLTTWSIQHAACVACGETNRRHLGKGYCTRCYFRVKNAS